MAASSPCIFKSPSDYGPHQLTKAKRRKVILQVGASLMLIGVNPECFTDDTWVRYFFLLKPFAKHLHPFNGISDELKLKRIMHIGVKNHTFDTIRGMLPGEFYKFLEFLQTKDGQQALEDLRTFEKLQKRWGFDLTTKQVAMLALADDCQRNDYVSPEIDQHIKDLRRQLTKAGKDREEKLGELRARFASTMTCPEIDPRTLVLECWNVLQGKIDYVLKLLDTQQRTIDAAFQPKNDDNLLLIENLSPTPADVRSKSLYFESLKKVQSLIDENHQLTLKLETALSKVGNDQGNVNFSEVLEKMENLIVVSNLTKVTETAVNAHSQAIRDTLFQGMGCEARPSAAKRMKMTKQSEKS